MSSNPDQWSPFAGFYANLIHFDTSVQVIFIFEFSLLIVLGSIMYAFYCREQQRVSTLAPLARFERTSSIRSSLASERKQSMRSIPTRRESKVAKRESQIRAHSVPNMVLVAEETMNNELAFQYGKLNNTQSMQTIDH